MSVKVLVLAVLIFPLHQAVADTETKGEYRISNCKVTYGSWEELGKRNHGLGHWTEKSLQCKIKFFDENGEKRHEWNRVLNNEIGSDHGVTSCLIEMSSEKEQSTVNKFKRTYSGRNAGPAASQKKLGISGESPYIQTPSNIYVLEQPIVIRDAKIYPALIGEQTLPNSIESSLPLNLSTYCRANSSKYRDMCRFRYGDRGSCEVPGDSRQKPSAAPSTNVN